MRGRITDDSARIVIATVKVTRGPDRLTLDTTTDSTGRFTTRFEMGTGDYLVFVSAPGFRTARRRVQRQANEHEFVVDFALVRDLTILTAVKVTAEKPVRASNDTRPGLPEPGSAEKWNDGVAGQVPPTVAGDLNALAATLSNVTITPAGPSILGSGAASNLTTLNGMGLAARSMPRAAQTQTRVTSTTYDATRGGFAGANVDVRLGPGMRDYQRRTAFLTFDPLLLQFVDATSRELGARSGGIRASVGADGEIIQEAATYNVALDVTRSVSDPASLLGTDAGALQRAGLAPDSVVRLVAVAAPRGVPVTGYGAPAQAIHHAVTWLGRVDDTRDSLRTRALTSYASITRDGGIGFTAFAAPSTGGEFREQTYGAQLLLDDYVGPYRRVLTETRIAASIVRAETIPYVELPAANVLVHSLGRAPAELASVSLGGGTALSGRDSRWSSEAANETDWNAGGRRHRFKALLWGRSDGLRHDGIANGLGTFTYGSIADLAAGHPSSFSRALTQTAGSGSVWNVAGAFAHQYAPSRYVSLLYGVRVEGNGFYEHPPINSDLERDLGVRSGAAPTHFHASPRLGFTYTYNRDKGNSTGTAANSVGLYYRKTTGVIRGGIGEFRDLLHSEVLANASAGAGLPGSASNLYCVGNAVPVVDWSRFLDPATVPSKCADGGGTLGESAPAVRLIDPSYTVPRSWRASLEWTTSLKSWLLRVEGLGSYDLSLPSTIDANFAGVTRLSLPSENGRPVFVPASAIDAASGLISPAESRRSTQFGRVANLVSDLRGYGGQLTMSASPDVFKFATGISLFASASYTLQASRRQYRGFDGGAFGDPSTIEWAANDNDARHSVVLTGGFATKGIGVVTMFARLQSGLPFTPVVLGDINGDGRGGDRAFVPNPATETDPVTEAQLRTVLFTGSPSARECIQANVGRAVGRNECRGPWTQSLNVQWRPSLPSQWRTRATPSVYFQNVFAGLDQLVHGADSQRGWGSPSALDPVLLVPRSFDASAQRFHYDVNPRFAETRPGRARILNPFRVVIDISFSLSTPFDVQQLRRALEPVRLGGTFQRRSADSITAFYLGSTSSIYKLLISESDSLFLSESQLTSLRRADSAYSAQVRVTFAPLGEYLSRIGGGAGKAEIDSVAVTKTAYWKIFWEQPEIAANIVTPAQRELMPVLKNMVAVPMNEHQTSKMMFDYPVIFTERVRTIAP